MALSLETSPSVSQTPLVHSVGSAVCLSLPREEISFNVGVGIWARVYYPLWTSPRRSQTTHTQPLLMLQLLCVARPSGEACALDQLQKTVPQAWAGGSVSPETYGSLETHPKTCEHGWPPSRNSRPSRDRSGEESHGPTHVARLEFPRETGLILRCAGKVFKVKLSFKLHGPTGY